MTTDGLPQAVTDFFGSTNADVGDRFLAAFADDAVLDDRGHEYAGRDAIAGWSETDKARTHVNPSHASASGNAFSNST